MKSKKLESTTYQLSFEKSQFSISLVKWEKVQPTFENANLGKLGTRAKSDIQKLQFSIFYLNWETFEITA